MRILLLLIATAQWANSEVRTAGRVESLAPLERGARFALANSQSASIEFFAANVIRVRYVPTPATVARETGAVVEGTATPVQVDFSDSPSAYTFRTSALRIAVSKDPFRLEFFWPDGRPMMLDGTPGYGYDDANGRVFTQKAAQPGERFLGIGARGGPLDRRGRNFVFFNVDRAEYKEFDDPLYLSFPVYYSFVNGRASAVFFDNAATPFFDLAKASPETVLLAASRGVVDYYLIAGPSPHTIARSVARLTGLTPLPPKWTLGYHQSRYSYDSEAELLDVAGRLRAARIPADVLWLDIDYMDRFNNLTWNPETFPNPGEMSSKLDANGFARVAIVEPLLLKSDPWWEELESRGFLLTDPDRKPIVNTIWYGDVGWMDFTLTPFRNWYKDRLKQFLDSAGIDGIWNDLNEPARNVMPEAVYDFDGQRRTDEEARNLYALKVTELSYQSMRELRPNRRPWIISRSGFQGIQRFSANWSGDAGASWESIRTNIAMSLGMAFTGQNFFGHDTGGFLGSPDPEMFVRWLQFSLYTPLFRNHADKDSARREPWVFAEPHYSIIRNTIEERYRLLPYLYSVMEHSSRTGDPFLAPPSFYFPSDDALFQQNLDFMTGPYILAAPIAEPDMRERTVRLPPGWWYDPASSTWHRGQQGIRAAAPLDRIPVFIREGSIIPRGPVIQHTREQASEFDLDVYPGADTAFSLYDDDGLSMDYTRGTFARTQFTLTHGLAGITLAARRSGGMTPPRRT